MSLLSRLPQWIDSSSPRSSLSEVDLYDYAVLTEEACDVATRAIETYGLVRAVVSRQLAAAAVMSNASCLMVGF